MHPSKLTSGNIYIVSICIFWKRVKCFFYEKHWENFVQIAIFVSFARQMIACLLSFKVFFYIIISRSHLKPSKNLYMSIRRVNKTLNFFPSSYYFRGLCNISNTGSFPALWNKAGKLERYISVILQIIHLIAS